MGAVASILGIALLPIGGFAALAIAWVAIVAVASSAAITPWRLVRGSLVALPFLLATLPLAFQGDGRVLAEASIGGVRIAVMEDGLVRALSIVGKSWLSVQIALLLAFTTPFHELVDGLRGLRVPAIIVVIIGFLYRYLAVIADEAARMTRARAARSAAGDARSGGSLRWRAQVTGSLVGSLFLRSYDRSERVHDAMQARGYEGVFHHRTVAAVPGRQLVALVALLAAAAGLVAAAHLWLPRT